VIEIHKGDPWRFLVRDDGVGFDSHNNRSEINIGLKIMQERANQIGATVDITSLVGQGTTVTLLVPISPTLRTRELPSVVFS
jgi:two-component system nitrate/nitrite sensor histidine kinase NarX